MKPITDDDLTLLYYGEHDDPELARHVARSPELSRRFEALGAELKMLDAFTPPERAEDFGAQIWQRMVPALGGPTASGPVTLLDRLRQPRFSLASVFSVLVVASLAFFLGRNTGEPQVGDLPFMDGSPPATSAGQPPRSAGVSPGRLINYRVSGHLSDVDQLLTQFANSDVADDAGDWATDMLIANRLYRRAAQASGNQQLARLLDDLEPLLIELAHQSHQNSPATRERLQQEVGDGLLFKVRVMNNELKSRDPA